MPDAQKSILITGCSSGIGRDAAITLEKRGWRVFATCRKEEDCERLNAEGFESYVLDYCNSDSIQSAFEETLNRTGGTLDALFNNGAHGLPGAVEDLPREGLRQIFEANFFGYHELTRLVIPIMRRQGHGRIVQCSSILGFVTMPWRGAYNATKYALEGLSDTLRIELNGTGIHVCLIQPGPINTKIRENSRIHFENWIDWEKSYHVNMYQQRLIPRLYQAKGKKDKYELPPAAVTKKLIHALESSSPNARYYVTFPTFIMGILKRLLSTRALDRIIIQKN